MVFDSFEHHDHDTTTEASVPTTPLRAACARLLALTPLLLVAPKPAPRPVGASGSPTTSTRLREAGGVELAAEVDATMRAVLGDLRRAAVACGVSGPLPAVQADTVAASRVRGVAAHGDLLTGADEQEEVDRAERTVRRCIARLERRVDPAPAPVVREHATRCPCGGAWGLPPRWREDGSAVLRCGDCGADGPAIADWVAAETAALTRADVLLTSAAAALRAGVPVGTVWSWASRGRLAAAGHDRAGQPLYRPADVLALAQRRRAAIRPAEAAAA